jgi:hypothetical protein
MTITFRVVTLFPKAFKYSIHILPMKKKRISVFLEFFIMGIILGIVEDIIIIKLLTDEPITLRILFIIVLVALPFSILAEYITYSFDFVKIFNLDEKYKKWETFPGFLIFGVVLGVTEDLIAFFFAVGRPITFKVFLVALLVAIPFAFLGERVMSSINATYEKVESKLKK